MVASLLFSVAAHEMAHGYAAYRMGDSTAMLAGRLTLNPLKHLDFIGSFLLPALLYFSGSPFIFGYARPVPVNFLNLRSYPRSAILVSAAGVLANLGIAALFGAIFRALGYLAPALHGGLPELFLTILRSLALFFVVINTVLAIFNLLPVPPLDGSRILAMVLPANLRARYERIGRFGIVIIFLLLITDTLSRFMSFFMEPIIRFLLGR